jgi:hypothetical protein
MKAVCVGEKAQIRCRRELVITRMSGLLCTGRRGSVLGAQRQTIAAHFGT